MIKVKIARLTKIRRASKRKEMHSASSKYLELTGGGKKYLALFYIKLQKGAELFFQLIGLGSDINVFRSRNEIALACKFLDK